MTALWRCLWGAALLLPLLDTVWFWLGWRPLVLATSLVGIVVYSMLLVWMIRFYRKIGWL